MGTIYSPIYPVSPRPAIPVVISIGKVSQVFALYDSQRNPIFQGGNKAPDTKLWLLLSAVTETLDWFNNYIPDHPYVEVIANYLWALITPYQIAALNALGNAGGIVINPQTGAPFNVDRYREDFAIGGIGGLPFPNYDFPDGSISYTVPLSGFFIAFLEPSGVDEMIGDTSQASITSIDYQPTYVRFNLNQPVRDGEKYIVWGLRGDNITNITGGNGTPIPLPLQRGKFLGNDGTNLIWDDVWIEVAAADFEADGKTYINTDLNGYYLGVEWINVPQWLNFETDEATLIDGGGFIVNLDGFDTTQNPDWRFKVFKKSL